MISRPGRNLYSMGWMLLFLAAFIDPNCQKIKGNIEFPYNIKEPDEEFILDKNLTEVSGLSFISEKEVALIQDEIGSIFYYNIEKKAITRKITFSKKGDFEDLKIMGDSGYVLRSDGSLIELFGLTGEHITESNLNTSLSGKNNTEGLCYDDQKKLLLIACKGKPEVNKKGQDFENKKAVYSFDPATKTLSDTPYVLIDVNDIQRISRGTYSNVIEKLVRFYTKAGAVHSFEPSGISIHPTTRELYIISSVGKVLVIVSPEGQLSNVIQLDPKVFIQPEGIAFDSNGNLYITNEGRQGRGNILKFNIKNKIPDLSL